MFRRRTDQVYSTLQQVQRRITEQNGGQSDLGEVSPANQPMPSVTVQPLSQALPSGAMPTSPAQVPQPFAGIPANRMASAGNRYVLQVSGELATTLVVMWLITMALMFFLGQHLRSNSGAGFAAGTTGNREASAVGSAAARQGDWIYILESKSKVTAESLQSYQSKAKTWNDYVLQNPQPGWKSYFGVRTPDNGGVEFVFGEVDRSVYGIDRPEFEAFAKRLSQPVDKDGGGFASARWVKVTP